MQEFGQEILLNDIMLIEDCINGRGSLNFPFSAANFSYARAIGGLCERGMYRMRLRD